MRSILLLLFTCLFTATYAQKTKRQGSFMSVGFGERYYSLKRVNNNNATTDFLKPAKKYNDQSPILPYLTLEARQEISKGYFGYLNATSQDDINFINYNIELGKKINKMFTVSGGVGKYTIQANSPDNDLFYEANPNLINQVGDIRLDIIVKRTLDNLSYSYFNEEIKLNTIHGKINFEKIKKRYQLSIGPKLGVAYVLPASQKIIGTAKFSNMPFAAEQKSKRSFHGFIEPQFTGSFYPIILKELGIDLGLQLKVNYFFSAFSYKYKETLSQWTANNTTTTNYRGPKYNVNRLEADVSLILRW